MMKGKQMSMQLDSCRSLTLSLYERVSISDSLLKVRNLHISVLEQLNINSTEMLEETERINCKKEKEKKKQLWRQGIVIGAAAFVLGLLTSIFI